MIPLGIFTAGSSVLLDSVLYHLTIYRSGDHCNAFFECTECGPNDHAEPVIAPNDVQAMSAVRQLAEEHHGQTHGRYAKKLAAREHARDKIRVDAGACKYDVR
jgi:hypothetical protein